MSRVTSVVIGTNADLIVRFAQLCIRPTDVVMDVTYGRGGFWKKYQHPGPFIAHDLRRDGVDFTHLSEDDATVDVTTADPQHGAQGGRNTSTIPDFLDRYGLDSEVTRSPAAVMDLYSAGMKEWARVTKPGGFIAVKCSDLTTSRKKRWGHEHVVNTGRALGLERWDQIILVRRSPGPQPKHQRQEHTDNQHSFLCIFRVPRAGR